MGPAGTLIAAAALGLAGGGAGWWLLRDTFAKPLFSRTNVRGAEVPVAVGVLLPIVLVAAASLLVLGDSAAWFEIPRPPLLTTVLAATGFGLLGLLDDLAGDGGSRGFGGHLRALGGRHLTTGAVKLFGGGAVAVLVASTVSDERPARLLADAALIALAANLANLLDRAPGRVAKAALIAAVPIVAVAGLDERLVGPVVVIGALVALAVPDLREQLMLGDTGANVVGATLGLAVVMTTAAPTRSIVLGVVLALNLLSERVSFSKVIERTPPLRALDRLGRAP
jgi:UDP-GlcNAc:undecaprenyl-phosphate GlcNAc-1-phosphate transferase